ncbi:MAG: CBS domain-containing protein [Anaerolineales bacterium]|jgi:acetoin utilization protein AcuB|nr:CBS domain-containing protein [Anaerolineales bacterium]
MLVRDWMTKKLITIRPESDPMAAISLLNAGNFRHLPVIESDGRLVGIVDRADIELFLAKAGSPGYVKRNHRVDQFMQRHVIAVPPDCPLEEAALMMVEHKIGSLPVLENGKLVGIITETDIFKRFAIMLGGGSLSLRLTIQLTDKPGQLAELAGRIAQANGNIVSVVSSPAEQPGCMNFTLRVEGLSLPSLLAAIEDQPGLVVLHQANG